MSFSHIGFVNTTHTKIEQQENINLQNLLLFPTSFDKPTPFHYPKHTIRRTRDRKLARLPNNPSKRDKNNKQKKVLPNFFICMSLVEGFPHPRSCSAHNSHSNTHFSGSPHRFKNLKSSSEIIPSFGLLQISIGFILDAFGIRFQSQNLST